MMCLLEACVFVGSFISFQDLSLIQFLKNRQKLGESRYEEQFSVQSKWTR